MFYLIKFLFLYLYNSEIHYKHSLIYYKVLYTINMFIQYKYNQNITVYSDALPQVGRPMADTKVIQKST